jgi:hypothetical protein
MKGAGSIDNIVLYYYAKEWNLRVKSLRILLNNKLKQELQTRQNWPMYAFVGEDMKLRKKDTWSDWFPESKSLRIYMHDNTDVPLTRPSDPDLQKALYSEYYGGCVGKGGVVLQQCGWIRTVPLCTGGIGDQDYLSKTKIFEKQKAFAKKDDTSDETGLNVLDKGYRSTLAAQLQGQHCFQPDFAQCDRKFNGEKTLHSAAVAVVRSGNERAVKQVKMSWVIKKGASLTTSIDLATLDNIWMGWGFRINFIYSPVH